MTTSGDGNGDGKGAVLEPWGGRPAVETVTTLHFAGKKLDEAHRAG